MTTVAPPALGDSPSGLDTRTHRYRLLSSYIVVAICALVLVGCAWLDAYVASIVALTVGIAALATADLRAILSLSYPAYALCGASAALSFLESGAYVSEQGRYGLNIGATPLLCLYSLGFLAVGHILLTIAAGGHQPVRVALERRSLPTLIVVTALSVTAFYLATFSLFGTGLDHASRFDWVATLPPAFRTAHVLSRTYLMPIVFILAGVQTRIYGWRRYPLVLISLAFPLAALLATGEKFSMFAYMVLGVTTGVGMGGFILGRESKVRIRSIVAGGLTVATLFALVASGYRRSGATDVVAAIQDRIALQGHVWFGILDRFGGKPGISLRALVAPNSIDSPSGLDLLSYYVADPNFVYRRLQRGVTFTIGGPPSALAAFGTVVGGIVYSLTALLYVVAILSAVNLLRRNRPYLAAATLALFLIAGSSTIMGNWDQLYGPIAIAAYLVATFSMVGVRRAGDEAGRARKRRPHPSGVRRGHAILPWGKTPRVSS